MSAPVVPPLVLLLALAVGTGPARAEPEPPADGPPAESVPDHAAKRSWLDDWTVLPILFYSPETEIGLGLAVIRGLELPEGNPIVSTVAFGIIYTTREQFITRLEPDLRFGDDAFVHAIIRYQRFPTRFFDPGAHPGDAGEPYDERSLFGHLDGRITATGKLRVGLRWEYRYNTVTEHVAGGELEASGLSGLGSYFTSGLGPVVSLDTRDDPRRPHHGVLAELRVIGFSALTGAGEDALQVGCEVRGYVDVGHGHVLAGEVHAQLTAGDLPFQLLPHLGGASHLRGWYEGHLRNRHALLGQLEWRFPIASRFGGAAFVALGEAVPGLGELSLERLRAGAGLGLRYLLNRRQNVSVRLDVAWGSGFGAYFDVLEAF